MKPWEFECLEPDQKAKIMALFMVERESEHYYHDESMRIMDAKEQQRQTEKGNIVKHYGKR